MLIQERLQSVIDRIDRIEEFSPFPIAASESFSTALQETRSHSTSLTDRRFDKPVNDAARTWRVEAALIRAVIANESGFDPEATSAAGAKGLMQLMPSTAAELGVTDPYDPQQNIYGGTRYLRGLLDRFGQDKRLALAAYNAGSAAVTKYGGVPPYAETQSYVQRVLSDYQRFAAAQ